MIENAQSYCHEQADNEDTGKGPLEGIPVSLKDVVSVAEFESCMGYSSLLGVKKVEDAPIVQLLRDAGELGRVGVGQGN